MEPDRRADTAGNAFVVHDLGGRGTPVLICHAPSQVREPEGSDADQQEWAAIPEDNWFSSGFRG